LLNKEKARKAMYVDALQTALGKLCDFRKSWLILPSWRVFMRPKHTVGKVQVTRVQLFI
jgi:hypothetical protein